MGRRSVTLGGGGGCQPHACAHLFAQLGRSQDRITQLCVTFQPFGRARACVGLGIMGGRQYSTFSTHMQNCYTGLLPTSSHAVSPLQELASWPELAEYSRATEQAELATECAWRVNDWGMLKVSEYVPVSVSQSMCTSHLSSPFSPPVASISCCMIAALSTQVPRPILPPGSPTPFVNSLRPCCPTRLRGGAYWISANWSAGALPSAAQMHQT